MKAIELFKKYRSEAGAICVGAVGILYALGYISKDQLEMYGHIAMAATGVAMRADLGAKGWKSNLGFMLFGVNGILAGQDVLDITQWTTLDAMITAFTGASYVRAQKKTANGTGGGSNTGSDRI